MSHLLYHKIWEKPREIEKLIVLKSEYNFDIYIDGAVTYERIKQWSPQGVNGFVLGTATLFNKKNTFRQTIENIRNNLDC